MFEVVFFQPCIPSNTGNAIRLSAVTGARLHLIEPLGFSLEDSKLRRAGLDYHDLATTTVHPDLEACFAALPERRVFAFTAQTETNFADVSYHPGDVLLFGPEPSGLHPEVLSHPRITELVRIPMRPARRSLNLANSAAIAVYEAWRQNEWAGGATSFSETQG